MKVVPIYYECGISGFEGASSDYREIGLSLDDLLIQNPNATFIGLASGTSMQEVGIYDGDLLIVDRSVKATNGSIVVANLNGSYVCKILDKQNKRLLSASNKHKPVYLTENDVFQLEGKVLVSVRKHSDEFNFKAFL